MAPARIEAIVPSPAMQEFIDAHEAMKDAVVTSFGIPRHLLQPPPPAMTDPLLQQLLLATAREPWEEWYGFTRLLLADWLEERGDERAALLRHASVKTVEDAAGKTHWISRIHQHPIRASRTQDDAERWLRWRILSLFPEADLLGTVKLPQRVPPGMIYTAVNQGNGLLLIDGTEVMLMPGEQAECEYSPYHARWFVALLPRTVS